MATIDINTQLADLNMGDGWADNYEAARGFAQYIMDTWREDLKKFADAGHDVNITVDIIKNTYGYLSGTTVTVRNSDYETALNLEIEALGSLTDENLIWEQWCCSERAEQYAAA